MVKEHSNIFRPRERERERDKVTHIHYVQYIQYIRTLALKREGDAVCGRQFWLFGSICGWTEIL